MNREPAGAHMGIEQVRWSDERGGRLKDLLDAFRPLPSRPAWSSPEDHIAITDLGLEVARGMLDEAEDLYAARRDQALRAEGRATTLQASAGVAIGLALTGAAFLIDPTQVASQWWRLALTVIFALMLFCLGMAGYIATRATAELLTYWGPTTREVHERAAMSEIVAIQDRAVHLLRYVDHNYYFAHFKIKQVKVAGLWFRAALFCFAALSFVLMLYTALDIIGDLAT